MFSEVDGYADETEAYRRQRQAELNSAAADRLHLEEQYGQIWSTQELSDHFVVIGFGAPFVVVKRKSDGKIGSLEFQSSPRFYFSFVPDERE